MYARFRLRIARHCCPTRPASQALDRDGSGGLSSAEFCAAIRKLAREGLGGGGGKGGAEMKDSLQCNVQPPAVMPEIPSSRCFPVSALEHSIPRVRVRAHLPLNCARRQVVHPVNWIPAQDFTPRIHMSHSDFLSMTCDLALCDARCVPGNMFFSNSHGILER